MKILFWIGLLLIAQAGGFVPVSGAYPAAWLFASLGLALAGVVLLIVLRQIDRDRYGDDGDSFRSSGPRHIAGDIDD